MDLLPCIFIPFRFPPPPLLYFFLEIESLQKLKPNDFEISTKAQIYGCDRFHFRKLSFRSLRKFPKRTFSYLSQREGKSIAGKKKIFFIIIIIIIIDVVVVVMSRFQKTASAFFIRLDVLSASIILLSFLPSLLQATKETKITFFG